MKRSDAELTWRLTDHVCRACMGRILARDGIGDRRIYRCSNCGLEREGGNESVLCCCGIRFGKGQRDAGIRCVPNTNRSPECMSEVVAQEVVVSAADRRAETMRRREEAQSPEEE